MSDTALSIRFQEAAGKLLRFVIDVRVIGESPKTKPITIQRIGGGRIMKGVRLAVIEPGPNGGWVPAKAPPPVTTGAAQLTVDLTGTPEAGATFWRWRLFVETDAGKGSLVVKHPDASNASIRLSQKTLNPPIAQKVVLTVGKFPRVVVGLNQATVPDGPPPAQDPLLGGTGALKVIAEHVVKRLATKPTKAGANHRADTLDAAWDVQGARPLPVTLPAGSKLANAEEAWARQVSEMLSLTPYAGTGLAYFGTLRHDGVFLADGIDGRSSNPVYGLVHACQHLAAFGVSSRGRTAHRFGNHHKLSGMKGRRLVSAGASAAMVVNGMGGTWMIGGTPPTPVPPAQINSGVDPAILVCNAALQQASTLYKIKNVNGCDFAPGSLFVMGNRKARHQLGKFVLTGSGSLTSGNVEITYKNFREVQRWRIGKSGLLVDNSDGVHIGFVVRTDPTVALGTTTLPNARFQLVDTGGFGVTGRGNGVTVLKVGSGFHNGNFDGPDAKAITGRVPYRGVGIWPRMTSTDAEALDHHVTTVLKKARPIGLARMVILERGKKVTPRNSLDVGKPQAQWMLYASPLVPMYEKPSEANYSLMRYAWSLRGTPARGAVDVLWWLYLPKGPLAQAMLDAGRGVKLSTLVDTAFASMTHPGRKRSVTNKDGTLNRAKFLKKYTTPIVDMHVTAAGLAEVTYKYPKMNHLHKLHYAEGRGWDGKVRLPMDQPFVQGTQDASVFPAYLRP